MTRRLMTKHECRRNEEAAFRHSTFVIVSSLDIRHSSFRPVTTDFFQQTSKVFTVAELTRQIRGALETRFGAVWVQG